jgi:hypothetical protein
LKPKAKDAGPAAASSGVAIHNRLPPMFPRRIAFESAIASALVGFKGNWDVAIELPGEQSLVVAVIAPDGSSWTMSCCDPRHRDPETIAETVRAACSRRRWLNPIGEADASQRGASPSPPQRPGSGGNRT